VDGVSNISVKTPHLRNGYEKTGFNAYSTRNKSGFGVLHDGTVLDLIAHRLAPDAVIVFDEFFNYKGYELHEYKAFFEFASRFEADYRFIGYSAQQVSLVVETLSQYLQASNELPGQDRRHVELVCK